MLQRELVFLDPLGMCVRLISAREDVVDKLIGILHEDIERFLFSVRINRGDGRLSTLRRAIARRPGVLLAVTLSARGNSTGALTETTKTTVLQNRVRRLDIDLTL